MSWDCQAGAESGWKVQREGRGKRRVRSCHLSLKKSGTGLDWTGTPNGWRQDDGRRGAKEGRTCGNAAVKSDALPRRGRRSRSRRAAAERTRCSRSVKAFSHRSSERCHDYGAEGGTGRRSARECVCESDCVWRACRANIDRRRGAGRVGVGGAADAEDVPSSIVGCVGGREAKGGAGCGARDSGESRGGSPTPTPTFKGAPSGQTRPHSPGVPPVGSRAVH